MRLQECVRCGICCISCLCMMGEEGTNGFCTYLSYIDGIGSCKLIAEDKMPEGAVGRSGCPIRYDGSHFDIIFEEKLSIAKFLGYEEKS